MSTIWSDAETRELVTLWPTASAAQIAKGLHRPIGAIMGKASRLRRDGVLPAGGEKHFAVSPWWARSPARASHCADKSAGATNAAPEKRTGRRRRARHAAVFVART